MLVDEETRNECKMLAFGYLKEREERLGVGGGNELNENVYGLNKLRIVSISVGGI
jgi:hypothetical protein